MDWQCSKCGRTKYEPSAMTGVMGNPVCNGRFRGGTRTTHEPLPMQPLTVTPGSAYPHEWARNWDMEAYGNPGEGRTQFSNSMPIPTYEGMTAGLERLMHELRYGGIQPGDELRATVEADLILMAHWQDRHGCNCGRHI